MVQEGDIIIGEVWWLMGASPDRYCKFKIIVISSGGASCHGWQRYRDPVAELRGEVRDPLPGPIDDQQ